MSGSRTTRSTHERNLERSLDPPPETDTGSEPEPPAAPPGRGSSGPVDVAGRLAREAAEREASRRAHGRPEGG